MSNFYGDFLSKLLEEPRQWLSCRSPGTARRGDERLTDVVPGVVRTPCILVVRREGDHDPNDVLAAFSFYIPTAAALATIISEGSTAETVPSLAAVHFLSWAMCSS